MAAGDKKPTKGGAALARLPDSHAEIAAKIGVDKSLVTRWISGARRPTDEQIAKITKAYGVTKEAWAAPVTRAKRAPKAVTAPAGDSLPAKPAAARPAPASAPATAPAGGDPLPDTMTPVERLQRFIQDGLRELEADVELPANKRAETLKKLADAQVSLSRSTGEDALTLQRIAANPEFRRLVRRLADALAPYPEALAAAMRALKPSEQQ